MSDVVIANKKVALWKEALKTSEQEVKLSTKLDLTLNPHVPRASFPGLTPFKILSSRDLLSEVVDLPSVAMTGAVSVCFGVLVSFIAFVKISRWRELPSVPESVGILKRSLGLVIKSVRTLLVGTCLYFYVKWLRSRVGKVDSISRFFNVSGSPRGPCMVGNKILMLTNSHAGTHADMPFHFSTSHAVSTFDEVHYSGDCLVLDVSDELRKLSPTTHAITEEVLSAALKKTPAGIRDGKKTVWRLILITRRHKVSNDSAWDTEYAFFYRESIEFLSRRFPNLLLIGIDSPSFDGEKASPICEHSHGALLLNGIANLENLDARPLYSIVGNNGFAEGCVSTIFSRVENFDDSKGCSVHFYPYK